MGGKGRGNLVIIGGAEDKQGKCTILRTISLLAGGREGALVVLTVAAEEPELTGEVYREVFQRLGVGEVRILHLRSRADAVEAGSAGTLEGATGIFFTGGDQLRITSILGGTPVDAQLRRRYEAGVVIAGTSAGAASMSETMIVAGASDDTPKRCTTRMAPGMGLLKEVVVDQHFAQRGRIGRLLSALAQNPRVLGIGIDEDTAVLVEPSGHFRVLGSQTVTVLDGKGLLHTNASESAPDEPLALTPLTLHVLPPGYGFDLAGRVPLPPE